MSPEFAYILKVNVAFALFYAFYRLFFHKDTFFKLRRSILLSFFGLALLYPFFNIQEWVRQQEPIAEVIFYYSLIISPSDTVPAETAANTLSEIFWAGIKIIYIAGAMALTFRLISQFISIVWLARQSRREIIQGVEVRVLAKPAGPFSFFRWIFLHPASHSEKEMEEILTHELTHADQYHSIDVLISELINIVFWFNPFVWLLKREVRHNLEYLADNSVLESGYDSRSYQYHLLGLAHHHAGSTQLYNSFNVLHLKHRIGMMNKKRSSGIGRTKYLMFIPLVILLMVISNMEAVARISREIAPSLLPERSVEVAHIIEESVADELTVTSSGANTGEVQAATEHVYTVVETMPSFPGGDYALLKFLSSQIVYPKEAIENNVAGRVVASFTVAKEGNVKDVHIVRSIHPSLDQEAIRVVEQMPKWTPGMQSGKPVSVKYTVPINFQLPVKRDEGGNPVFTVVEQMPVFPGGDQALLRHISQHIKYPVNAQDNGIQGRVIASIIVDKDGNVKDPQIVRGLDPDLDKEAIRVLSSLPKWAPGQQRGKNVAVKYTIPIQFRLQ